MGFIEFLKAVILGIVQGITEWLPISSTGHMILVDQFLKLDMSKEFITMFLVVIQLGSIMAVVLLYWRKLLPFSYKEKKIMIRKNTMVLWGKILVACLPAAVIGLIFGDFINAIFWNPQTIAVTLILYGILFIVVENWKKNKMPEIRSLSEITYKTALFIGIFQVLALIPGTSRSGATIIGAILVGTSRTIAAEFTFFLAIPIMFGASLLEIIKFGFFTGWEVFILLTGMITAFVISVFAIQFLMTYIKKHDFKIFGWYRIVLGIIVIGYFIIIG
ncbi:MAG: undecaprenyl-diphosphate phosphatase [Eubacteriaceae bacterium]|nr:undecaprenyl-diphosphate phosphatase [Eubacteriaceae bacterium]